METKVSLRVMLRCCQSTRKQVYFKTHYVNTLKCIKTLLMGNFDTFNFSSSDGVDGAHSVKGVQTVYQACFWTQTNVMIWKPKQMRIWVNTENSKGPEMRPDGGRRGTRSFHAGFRLTEKQTKRQVCTQTGHWCLWRTCNTNRRKEKSSLLLCTHW